MARLTLPSRLELNSLEGSFNAAPLANVILTTFLYVSPVQTMPPCDQTGVPGEDAFCHFHSSTISGSACLMRARIRERVLPRQSSSSFIRASIIRDGDSSLAGGSFFMLYNCFKPRSLIPVLRLRPDTCRK